MYSNGDVATFQLNQSLKYLAYKMGIPLFHWSELVRNDRSEEERKDYMHWNKMCEWGWVGWGLRKWWLSDVYVCGRWGGWGGQTPTCARRRHPDHACHCTPSA